MDVGGSPPCTLKVPLSSAVRQWGGIPVEGEPFSLYIRNSASPRSVTLRETPVTFASLIVASSQRKEPGATDRLSPQAPASASPYAGHCQRSKCRRGSSLP